MLKQFLQKLLDEYYLIDFQSGIGENNNCGKFMNPIHLFIINSSCNLLNTLLPFQGARTHAENWSSLDSRKDWEQTFRNQYLQPVFRNIDSDVAAARAVVRKSTAADRLTLSR